MLKRSTGFGVKSFKDVALEACTLRGCGHVENATGLSVTARLLGQTGERKVRTECHSFSSESVNRWCTNAILARSNARDSVRNIGLTIANAVRRASWLQRRGHTSRAGLRRAICEQYNTFDSSHGSAPERDRLHASRALRAPRGIA